MKWENFKPEAASLKLYGYWRSSASWRVRWALELKKIPYAYVPVNFLTSEHSSPEHLARNPAGALPVLEINDGHFLAQSVAMLEWIDEVYALQGPALYPGTPLERAHVRELCEIINADTHPIQVPRVQKQHSQDPAAREAWAQHFIRQGLETFEKTSRKTRGKYCLYEHVSAADLFLIPQVYNALRFKIDVAKELPALWEIYERCMATEACQKASPERQVDAPKN